MKVREKNLEKLAGCYGCNRKCLWNGAVANPDGIAQESSKKDSYKCNPSRSSK